MVGSYLVQAGVTDGRVCVFAGPFETSGQNHGLVNVITGNQLIQPEHNIIRHLSVSIVGDISHLEILMKCISSGEDSASLRVSI